ncbi:beta-galactosidase [Ktedonobacter racemifer]|uniref:Beta-galactosidase n=1 Tax=Ktedonobacter racemifer DSM 44963 TaxID=485913 RepID=D6TT41_KTERA|nr:beta-galactosidase [Ktedonobacter racemifer]EFH83592.1 Beta-galactosidase [Ktedonobacter racemifer DSM 44963]
MITIKDKQILIDGQARVILAGEIHYFRLKRAEWQDRITKLKEAGCNAVASYIPWLCHEQYEGRVDLEGRTLPELDLGAFIDLCKDNGLYFFVRPGPFIMAEMKNEGLPFWLYTKHPEIVPLSWDGQPVPTHTVDYLAPTFLQEVRRWYSHVMGIIAPRLYTRGGNIIAVQLDNEVGMLSWVSNRPDLTTNVLADFTGWLKHHYTSAALKTRYPFALDNTQIRDAELRSPKENFATALRHDLGYYMRDRFARYVSTLRSYAEEFGVTGVPFIINVHGTDAGRGLSFPIGISQLYEAYTRVPGYIAGSDHYLGELQISNFQDLYLMNAFMDAVNLPDQPLTSVEFESGDGDYGGSNSSRHDPSTTDFKIRMCMAQGNKLLSYYLFSGGINYLLPELVHDGNDRIAFTGERHGFAAPVNPEGKINYSYWPLARANKAISAVADKLATMYEEHDSLAFAFIPDYYMTEYRYPSSTGMNEIVRSLEASRGRDAWEAVARAMLLACYRFGALDVQNGRLDPQSTPVLVLPSARYMDRALQDKLVNYLQAGGKLLLYGEVPLFDMEGQPANMLARTLGLKPAGAREATHRYFLSLRAEGWAAPRPEVRTDRACFYEPARGEVLLRASGTGEACGFDIQVGQGRAVIISAAYPCDVSLFRTILERLGAQAALDHHCEDNGIFMTTSATATGERLLHILNLDGFDKEIYITEYGQPLFEGRSLLLRRREGLMLPLNLSIGDTRIVYSTAEIAGRTEGTIEFRLTQAQDTIVIVSPQALAPGQDYDVERHGDRQFITPRKSAALDDRLILRLEA